MDTLMSIKTFRQVIESGSFVAAAERLDMFTAMVSKHVMHIEKRLGVRLLNRNPRTLSLTEPGAVYLRTCLRVSVNATRRSWSTFHSRIESDDLVQEGYDLALRATSGALPMGLVARRLQPLKFLIGASREYLKSIADHLVTARGETSTRHPPNFHRTPTFR